jgi:hypothetical protein
MIHRHVIRIALAALVLASVAPRRADANTVFSQAPPLNNANGYVSDFGEPKQRADNFSLGAATTVTSIRWWGSYFGNASPALTNFSLRFFADAAGTPVTAPFYSQAITGATRTATALVDASGDTIYQFDANLPVSQLFAGSTTFYASVVENVAGSTFFWVAQSSGPDWVRNTDADAWQNLASNANFAFELFDANGSPAVVPTPTAAAGGFAVALLGMLISRRRARFE